MLRFCNVMFWSLNIIFNVFCFIGENLVPEQKNERKETKAGR